MSSDLSKLPRVDRVVAHSALEAARSRLGGRVVTDLARLAIAETRRVVQEGGDVATLDVVAGDVARRAQALLGRRSSRVLNATGVLLHTNLGRAPLAGRAAAALATADGACSIELDLETGKRGGRGAFAETALATLTGAESALVVNNCAAAVLLMLASVARGRPVLVSRGELVEIGGGFRVPDVMAESGCELVEVGTTNKTRVADYANALDARPDAVAVLRVHQGNFRQIGFVERPTLSELGALARARGVLLLKDLGGGALIDLAPSGFVGEPTAPAAMAAGCDIVTFSTDKVLGGPQGGALIGSADLIGKLRRHPLARALRLGRLPMVALEETLSLYLEGRAQTDVPTLRMAFEPADAVEVRARSWASALIDLPAKIEIVPTRAEMGGGALAGRDVASWGISLGTEAFSVDELATRLRLGDPAVMGRALDGRLVLDARTIADEDSDALLRAVRAALS